VFSGAGISGDAPASLPRGFGLRDDLLKLMHAAARESIGSPVTDGQLAELLDSGRKLEVVLARLSGSAGTDAADCLLALRLLVPNEAHMLAALHLALGGIHATLNFDIGIELAYELLTGRYPTAALPDPYDAAASAWLGLAPADAPALRAVASHIEFDAWVADGKPPALLKIHGSLSRDQARLLDVVVLDIDELGQLTPSRSAAVETLGSAQRLLITGYSGADPDVYEPLLAAAQAPVTSWCCYSLPAGSPVWQDCRDSRVTLRVGPPAGLAVTALRELLGLTGIPSWPQQPLPVTGYPEFFSRWAQGFRATRPADKIAVGWAWLLADGGDLDTAEHLLSELASRPGADADTLMRHAEVLYTRDRGNDRTRAGQLYRQIAGDKATGSGTRLMCRLRRGDIARGYAIRNGRLITSNLIRAFTHPLLVLAATRAGRTEHEAAADAYRGVQPPSLRALERIAATGPRWSWPVLALLCRGARRLGAQAERLAGNGNRRSLIRQHRLLLSAYESLLASQPPPPGLQREIQSLRDSYRNANDLPGAGNLAATLAIVATTQKDTASARRLIDEAREDYTAGRPDARPIASGQALLHAVARIIARA
jgi:hypothetical protein